VLCLHGFAQNADVFRKRTGSIRKPLKKSVDFIFVDGPHSAAGAFPDSERGGFDGEGEEDGSGPRGWWVVGENAAASVAAARASLESASLNDDEDAPVASASETTTTTAWVRPALSREMRGWEDTAACIREAVASQGPFDGVFAFSQGASTAALALALVPELAASVRFAVLVAGFEPMDPDMVGLYKLNPVGPIA
jgi:pimeloyl-ACP methyl ester carboxylesterase